MSSVFASRITKDITLGEHTVTIRKLATRHLIAAQRAQQMQSIADLKAFGGIEFVRSLQTLTSEKKAEEKAKADEEQQANPLASYDRATLLAKGISAWTFTEEDGTVAPIDDAHVDDLDDEIAEQLAREILQLAKPSLFTDPEEARKNG